VYVTGCRLMKTGGDNVYEKLRGSGGSL